ncbi:MAG: DUF4091 domain-containing protein [Clostridia bacterium]|nr:DUF4091 domain-containing protein [Clostridia bacterium]
MILTKITSSLEKIFADETPLTYPELKKLSALRGERVSVQYMFTYDAAGGENMEWPIRVEPKITGSLAKYVHSVRDIYQVPVVKPVIWENGGIDDNYLRTKPGLFPDVLNPLQFGGKISIYRDVLSAIWIEFRIPEDAPAGEYDFKIEIDGERFGKCENSFTLSVIGAALPKEDIYFTQWFHSDCLADYYRVPAWSEEHWRIVENFARVAAENGINALLTPIFTPPLDTAVGGERTTVQLLEITKCQDKYTFDFTRLGRWVDMCDRVGIKYFEIAHLFTQWGAAHAPKIMATENGEYKKIFGWDTDSTGPEYVGFLRQLLTELLAFMKARGRDKDCLFHISDEPHLEHLEKYRAAKNSIIDILDGYKVMDALSDIELYKQGVVNNPIPATNHIKPFLEAKIPHLWTYYCVSQNVKVSNRFHAMPAWRNRSIGMQLFKFDIEGFLQWGYNFYNNQWSTDHINPYLECGANLAFTAGDCFSVYPASDGTALESARIIVFHEALQDVKAMKLCAALYGKDAVVAAIEGVLGDELTFERCAYSSREMLLVREVINKMISEKV